MKLFVILMLTLLVLFALAVTFEPLVASLWQAACNLTPDCTLSL